MIGEYPLYLWLFFGFFYSLLGWIFESAYVSLREKRPVNRGFVHGPLLPIYGTGAVMMLVISGPVKDNLILTFFAGLFFATVLEYIVGASLEAIFKVRYWDYSPKPFNYKGHICLSSSIAWGFFTIAMNRYIHVFMLGFLEHIPDVVIQKLLPIFVLAFSLDLSHSIREALDLRAAILRLEDLKHEVRLLRKRADVVLACMDDDFEQFVKEHPAIERIEEFYLSLEERLESISARIEKSNKRMTGRRRKELKELRLIREKLKTMHEQRMALRRDHRSRLDRMIRRNPSMNSRKHPEIFKKDRK